MTKEVMNFDAEVEKLFQLVIHSLYENKEIFLRELISNASDACDKLRYNALSKPELLADDAELRIQITADKEAGTLTITDNGIGMTRAEMVKNLGTIARSGTQNFVSKLSGDSKKDSQLIGQFGVGFYSSFMVADSVRVVSRAAGKKAVNVWQSAGKGSFEVEEASGDDATHPRGTSITLQLSEDASEYLDHFRIKHIVETYSNHIAFPISFKDGETDELLNDAQALWLRPKSEITDEEYKTFYTSISFMGNDEPWLTLHNKVEGVLEYTSLLYIPSSKPFDLFHPDRLSRVKLYAKRVFVAEQGVELIPPYLRFMRGVVDSEDLPLNISRETIQNNATLHKIKRGLTKRVLSELKKRLEKDHENYLEFWNNFGPVIKEGLCEATEPRDELVDVCLFRTSKSGEGYVTLKEYKERMQDDQSHIYYITADSVERAMSSPQLEGFKGKDIEVILLTDSVDDFWVNVLYEYQGAALKSVTRSSADLDDIESDKTDETSEKDEAKDEGGAHGMLVAFIKETLGEQVEDVKTSTRLTDSPVCLSVPDGAMDIRMERFMVENKQLPGASAKIFEVNPKHPIIQQLEKDATASGDKSAAQDLVHLLFAQANIIEGEPLNDVDGFRRRMNSLLEARFLEAA